MLARTLDPSSAAKVLVMVWTSCQGARTVLSKEP